MNVTDRTAAVISPTSPPEPPRHVEAQPLSPEDAFPAVVAGSGAAVAHMIDLMEAAAARLMRRYLRDGESSVAVDLRLLHAAYAHLDESRGVAVRATAIHRGAAGRLHRFTLHAFDATGLIGSAEQTRAVVVERRLLALARKRVRRPAMLLHV
jgi:predicted thioesterase